MSAKTKRPRELPPRTPILTDRVVLDPGIDNSPTGQATVQALLDLLLQTILTATIDSRVRSVLANLPAYSGSGPAPVASGLPFLNNGYVQIAK